MLVQNSSVDQYPQNLLLDFLRRAGGVHEEHTPGFANRQEPVSLSHSAVKLEILLLKAAPDLAPRISCPGSLESQLDIDIKDQGKVGHGNRQDFSQPVYQLKSETASVALVSQGRVVVSIAKHMATGRQSRLDSFLQVLAAVSEVKQQLRDWLTPRSVPMEQDLSHLQAELGAARFPRRHKPDTPSSQLGLEKRQLEALSGPLNPLESNKFARLHSGSKILEKRQPILP